jgi:hypothetical protein
MRALRSFVPVLACAGTLITAGPAMGADIQTSPGLPDLDVRSGHIAPTAAQRAGAKAPEVAWNQFGTPSTLVRSGGTLGTAGGATASDAARAWLDSNRSLFRLGSVDGLAVVDDAKLADSATHAVTLRQTPDARRPRRLGRRDRHDRRREGGRAVAGDLRLLDAVR